MADQDFITALEGAREIELTVTGRRSGREITIPVWFVQDERKLYLVPIHGSDSDWYKNLRQDPTVRLAVPGAEVTAAAVPVSDPARVAEVVDAFRAKYGAAEVEADYPKQDAAVEVPLD
jgi:deazaflavin-dependent oxidoreductase (nitroreductase family)